MLLHALIELPYRKFTIDISGGQNKTKRQLWRIFLENYRLSQKEKENYRRESDLPLKQDLICYGLKTFKVSRI